MPVPAVVLLVLLLAPDAYLDFGFLLLVSVIAWTTRGRSTAIRWDTASGRPPSTMIGRPGCGTVRTAAW